MQQKTGSVAVNTGQFTDADDHVNDNAIDLIPHRLQIGTFF